MSLASSLNALSALAGTQAIGKAGKGKPVRVVIRTRPTAEFCSDIIKIGPDNKSISIHIPKGPEGGYINNQQEDWDFLFDNVLHNASQETIYDDCGAPVVKQVLEGMNGTIMAYGQTGAGKTFSMTGATENYKNRGLIPRAISHLFREIHDRPQMAYTVRVSYLEIYNEQMNDLLANLAGGEPADAAAGNGMVVVEDKNGSSYVKGLTMMVATNEEEALNLLFEGETNRAISEHQMNRSSSRSHCIFTVYIESKSRVESSEKVMFAKLNLVDLAGSERLSKTHTTGASLKEAMYINKSLTFLEQVIIALSDKKRDHVPYRQSKLSNVLRDALGGNCNTLLIGNIWGVKSHIEETISTLRFATRMKCVMTTPTVNVQFDPVALIKKYEREIRDLKQELSMHDTLASRSHIQYEPYTDSQRHELQKQVKLFLDNEEEELEIVNLRQIKELFTQFRNLYKLLETEHEELSKGMRRAPSSLVYHQVHDSGKLADILEKDVENTSKINVDVENADGVGEAEGTGFGVGIAGAPGHLKVHGGAGGRASKMAPPAGKQRASKVAPPVAGKGGKGAAGGMPPKGSGNSESRVLDSDDDFDDGAITPPGIKQLLVAEAEATHTSQLAAALNSDDPFKMAPADSLKNAIIAAPPSRSEEFENFKKAKGADLYKILTDNKNVLKEKKRLAKETAERVNETKKNMDVIKFKIDKKKEERLRSGAAVLPNAGEDNIIIDEEEYALLGALKEHKQKYRDQFELLRAYRGEAEYCSKLVDQCRMKLMAEFEMWYEAISGHSLNDMDHLRIPDEDTMDIGEKFDKLQLEKMAHEDPESVAFYSAKQNTDRRTKHIVKNIRLK